MNGQDSWIARNWRPLTALAYILICFFDFVVMPIFSQWSTTTISPDETFKLMASFTTETAQIEALHVLRDFHPWQPVTLSGAGLFHITFGAILGVTAWTKGSENIAKINQSLKMAMYQSYSQHGDKA